MTNPIPEGYHSITPYLYVHDGLAAMEFYRKAFNAVEMLRMEGPPGTLAHGEMKIGNSHFMLSNESPDRGFRSPQNLGGTSGSLMIYVDDVDAVFKQALDAGATELQEVKDQFYGDRSGMITDPFGHQWTLATHMEDVPPDEMDRRAKEFMASMGG